MTCQNASRSSAHSHYVKESNRMKDLMERSGTSSVSKKDVQRDYENAKSRLRNAIKEKKKDREKGKK